MNRIAGSIVWVIMAAIPIVGILIYLWGQSADVARVGLLVSICTAAATLELAAVAFYQIQVAQKQFNETQHAQIRPLLIPRLTLTPERLWAAQGHEFTIQNIGRGPATNVWGVILPAANPTSKEGTVPDQFCMRGNLPIASDESVTVKFEVGGTIFNLHDKIANVRLSVPEELSPEAGSKSLQRRDRCGARLTLSYSDIFGLKHASVFDLTQQGRWLQVAILNGITNDLGEMDQAKGTPGRIK